MQVEILLKVIERVHTKNPGMQKLIDESMIDICKEESVSPQHVFLAFLCCWFYRYELSKHRFFAREGHLIKMLGFIFSGDKEKSHVEFFDAGILRV